jgi:TonB family protein
MQTASRLAISALLLLPAGACAHFQTLAACSAPHAIQSTHTSIPYPPISQRLGEQGTTRLTVDIGADGAPAGLAVTQSSHSRRLDQAAAAYIEKNYRWETPPKGCTPPIVQAAIVVNWRLDPLPDDDYVAMSAADYPAGALERAEEGVTELAIEAGDGGLAKEVKVLRSSGSSDLDAKALAAAKSGTWDRKGQPAGTRFLSVSWRLPGSAIAAQRRKGLEILDIHVPRIQIQAECGSAPVCF